MLTRALGTPALVSLVCLFPTVCVCSFSVISCLFLSCLPFNSTYLSILTANIHQTISPSPSVLYQQNMLTCVLLLLNWCIGDDDLDSTWTLVWSSHLLLFAFQWACCLDTTALTPKFDSPDAYASQPGLHCTTLSLSGCSMISRKTWAFWSSAHWLLWGGSAFLKDSMNTMTKPVLLVQMQAHRQFCQFSLYSFNSFKLTFWHFTWPSSWGCSNNSQSSIMVLVTWTEKDTSSISSPCQYPRMQEGQGGARAEGDGWVQRLCHRMPNRVPYPSEVQMGLNKTFIIECALLWRNSNFCQFTQRLYHLWLSEFICLWVLCCKVPEAQSVMSTMARPLH